MRTSSLVGGACAAAVLVVAGGPLNTPYAIAISSLSTGPNNDFGVEENMLGQPHGGGFGAGSNDVYALGQAGQVVLEFDVPVYDGPGSDFLVCENPFTIQGSDWDTFVELLTVEVSSDGVHWARFPTDFDGPPGPYMQGSLQLGTDLTDFDGFAGVMPVFADPPLFDDQDIVEAGGDAFDLAALAADPLVLSGQVDLDDIGYLRLTDVVGGTSFDDDGDLIWDCGNPSFANADVDAVVGLNLLGGGLIGRPTVEFTLDPQTQLLTLAIGDEDGLYQIKHGLRASLNGLEVPFAALLPFFVLLSVDGEQVVFVTGPVPPGFDRTLLKVSAEDITGRHGGDAVFLK